MGDMRDEFRHLRSEMEQIRATCGCGQPKGHPSHLACDACLAKTPQAMRDEFFDLARRRRGSNSYHVLRRRIVAELAKIHTARRDSEPGHQSDAAGTNPPGAAPGRATSETGAA
jgi:hypothetical protein